VTSQPPINERFAEVVKRIADGRSTRELYRATGVSHSRVSDMAFGIVPGYRLLARFADGLELSPEDRRELFAAAGYGDEDWDPDKAFMAGIRQIAADLGVDITVSAEDIVLARQTPEGVAAALAAIRKRLEARMRKG
jgi:hypothetical protein